MRSASLFVIFLALCGCSKPEIRHAEQQTQEAPPPPPPAATPDPRHVLLVFGDSLSAGFGLGPGLSFPDFLQKKLDAEKYPWHVVNQGISGDTTEGGVARLDAAVALKPEIVVLELGGNDGLRGLPLQSTRENLNQMILAFQKAGAKIVLAGMTLPPNYGSEYIHQFEQIYRDLAKEHKTILIPFLLSDIITSDMRFIQKDGIHPTAAGCEIVSGTVFRAVKPLLKQ
jgi:acyl-CoA thioesterase-1